MAGFGKGLDGVSPQERKTNGEENWEIVCRYQMARATAWTKEIPRGSLPKTAPISLHNFFLRINSGLCRVMRYMTYLFKVLM